MFTSRLPQKSRNDINKVYLSNTILSVESHNRREEESDCWRENKMIKRARQNDLIDTTNFSRGTKESSITSSITEFDEEERAVWAAKKVIAHFCSFSSDVTL